MEGILDRPEREDQRLLLGRLRLIAMSSNEPTSDWKCWISGGEGRYFVSVRDAGGGALWNYAGPEANIVELFKARLARIGELRKSQA